MKRFLLLSTLILGLASVYGQTQITLTFTGKDSISQNNISLDSVYVKNMDELCDTTLYGPSPVFLLTANWPVGINEPGAGTTGAFVLKQNYPNPFQGSTHVSIYKEYQGTLNLALYDQLGTKLAEYHHDLDKGYHSFMVTSSGDKVLFLVASDNKSFRAVKIVSMGQSGEGNDIRYLGPDDQSEKSMAISPDNTGFIFYLGNQLMYTAYSGGYHDNTIFDFPAESTIYTFNMVPVNIDLIPTVTTSAVINITQTTATSGGNVISDGGAPVTERGVCWSTSPNPNLANDHTINGSGTGTFFSYLTGLDPNTLYYLKAYATNSVGTAYGNETTFTTLDLSTPTVTTSTVTNIAQTNATSGGDVTSDGGATVTERGVCWSTSPDPTTADPHTLDGSGTGIFVSILTGLTSNTLYYVRAYATNSIGTTYGNQQSFTTALPWAPMVSTHPVTFITPTSAISGGDVSSDGGATVTARGVCWSTSADPTTADSHTTDGGGLGWFESHITGLTPNTQYYVRAYATNIVGTGYGNEMGFYTVQLGVHYIGESFGGGIIFYLDGTGQHGLIAAASDQSVGAQWGCNGTLVGASGAGIGTGQTNTTAIVNGCSTPGIAARICDSLVLNGYSDWFLPSNEELWELFYQQEVIGGWVDEYYWSSTEVNANQADAADPITYDGYEFNKNSVLHVRAIRAF